MKLLPLLFYLGTVLVSQGCGFSVDVDMPTIFQVPTKSFGATVAQTTNMVLVGAPLQIGEMNEVGKLYRCTFRTRACEEINIQRPVDAVNISLGLSLAVHDSQVLVCGPTVHRACGENMYVNGYCFLLDQNLQQRQHFPETLPECLAHPTDIVFLIDGSGSISGADFERMKQFVSEIIKRLSGRDTQFALMQFSDEYKEHFNFNSKDPARLVMDISQISGMTNTATAIRKVVRELFTSRKGSRKEATKILIVITDGEKSDNIQYWEVIPEAEQAGIIRYAVGVGSAFSSIRAKQELDDIASEPDGEHVFTVYNFDALKGIQDQLQNKIFAIEGTKSQSSSSFQMEMSQEGFSALLTQEGPVIGAVGSYDWTGGVFLYQNSNKNPSFVNISSAAKNMDNAYLGYSSQPVQLNGRIGLVVGAPRYDYVGRVVLFEKHAWNGGWQLKTEAVGEQVGSYFGATLCSVDLDQDTNTDLVLVGAPMYYDGITGGRVYVCHFMEESLHCSTSLKGQGGHIFGRFGASMAETGDITGDGWMDVAIGAPLEDENTGALYIFAGKPTTLNPQYIQRIEGLRFTGGFLYFGQTVSGGTDLTGDGLKDLVVGQQGQVLLMRSRPVLHMRVSIEFHPTLISTSVFKCQGQEPLGKVASEARVCFTVSKATGDKLGSIVSDLQYNLALDSERTNIRASFISKSAVLNASFQIGLERKCEVHAIKLPICIEDTLTPITLRLNYSLVGKPITAAQNLQPILSKESQQIYTAQLPFEKNCGSDGKCEDILQTSFTFSGLNTLIVGLTLELNVTASIQNHGEDSYSTTLSFFYPVGLSYRKITLLQPSKNVASIKCHSAPVSDEQYIRNATCNVNHPIFWSRAQAIFVATFDVSPDAHLGDTLWIMAKANSESGGNITKDMVHQADLPVKYAVYIVVSTTEESTKYVNFTAGQEGASKSVEHRYQVKNLRKRSIPVSVTFQIPVKLKGIQVWDVSQVIPSEPQITNCTLEKETASTKDFPSMEDHPVLDCSVASCKTICCDILLLEFQKEPLEFRIKGNVSFQWASQIQQNKVTLVSSAKISYDDKKYSQKEGFVQTKVQTVVERIENYNFLPVIIGSTVGGLVLLGLIAAALYKVGFFKRQYKQMLHDTGSGNEATETSNPSPQGTDSSPPDKDADY
ncbi:integrin alpha-M-like [Sceloporus undulatus]|uniref:integrin alpha-M-like n=1 Tax=Sceloporus undulatus TaxID=8520 RepID=UPI001C4C8322|nr:integrin alpha-M-like [Sceloporus undulatus]